MNSNIPQYTQIHINGHYTLTWVILSLVEFGLALLTFSQNYLYTKDYINIAYIINNYNYILPAKIQNMQIHT